MSRKKAWLMRQAALVEPQLAIIWRWWLTASKLFKVAAAGTLKEKTHHVKVAQMYKSSARFWATNNPTHLEKALRIYYELRPAWLDGQGYESSKLRIVSGWAEWESLKALRVLLPNTSIRRSFRPDVWYLRGKKTGFFSGFEFKATPRQLKALNSLPGFRVASEEKHLSYMASSKISPEEKIRLESISPAIQRFNVDWLSAFLASPKDFAWLVEASADSVIANMALNDLKGTSISELNSEFVRCLAVFSLVSREHPKLKDIGPWRLHRITEPNWVNLDKQDEHKASAQIGSKVPERYFLAKDVSVTNGGVITGKHNFYDWDRAQNPSLDFVAGNSQVVLGTSANLHYCYLNLPVATNAIPKAILLTSRVDSNWFHFLIETLPRLLIVENIVGREVPVVVSSRIPRTALEALALVTKREIILIDAEHHTIVSEAIIPGPVIYHPDTQFLWGDDSLESLNVSILKELRTLILQKLQLGPSEGNDRIYWPRISNYRRVVNSNRLGKTLTNAGFVTQDPSGQSFSDQVRGIYNCRKLVAVGGALMSNFIFASNRTEIVVLVSDFGKTYPWPRMLAGVAGSALSMVGGPPIGIKVQESIVQKSHASFKSRIRELRKAIKDGPPRLG